MNKSAIILALALGVSAWSVTAQEQGGPPPSGQPPSGREGGPGGPGGPGGQRGFHLLPPPVQAQLNLTADQQKQLAALEAEVKAKLEKILTPDQMEKLKQMRPPPGQGRMGGGGPGGAGPGRGGPGGGQGSTGGEGAPKRPPQE